MNFRLKEMNAENLRSFNEKQKKEYILSISKMDLGGVEDTIKDTHEKIKFKSFRFSAGEAAAATLFRVG